MTLPFVAHSEPSREAAAEALPRAALQREAVLAAIRARGDIGATDEELQLILHLAGNSERPRRRWLQQQGLIRDSGLRRAPAHDRVRATVWVACWPGSSPTCRCRARGGADDDP